MLASLLIAALTPVVATPALADPGDTVVVEGAGWGHGIGMSQYGARGQAIEGKTAAEIVEYYYSGSTVAGLDALLPEGHFMLDDPSPVWISLETNASTFRFHAVDGPVQVCHLGHVGCSLTANPGEAWTFDVIGDGTCRFRTDGNNATVNAGPCTGTIRGLTADGSKVDLDDQPSTRDTYARGQIQLRTPDAGGSVHASLEIGMDKYLFGLAEVPASWETEALRAQAIAARSYASYKTQIYGPEAEMSESRKTQCWCHMFATVADQSFIGWDREDDDNEQPWVAAVSATSGLVASHPSASQNNVVAAFYSSSTGGATQNNEDVWGGSPIDYLRSVPDPWSIDPAVGNPFDSWSFSFSEADLANRFGIDTVSGIDILERYDSGAPSRVRILGRDNGARYREVWTGAEVRSALGLTGRHIWTIDHGSTDFVVGDFDGSGTGDAAVLLGATGSWFEYSDGGWARAWGNHADNSTISGPNSGDFDGDGTDDIVIRRSDTGARIVGLGGGGYRMRFWNGAVEDPTSWHEGVVGDFNGDGKDDIAEYRASTGVWSVLLSTGSAFARTTFYDFSAQNPQWGEFLVGDYDGDGLDDILHHDLATENLHVLFSNGAGFTPKPWGTLPADSSWRLRQGDFNDDGSTDVAAFDTATGAWWVTLAGADRTPAAPSNWWTFQTTDFDAHVIGDFNGDGRDDIANLAGTRQMLVLTSKPNGGFGWGNWGSTPQGQTVSDVMAFDNDGDGDDDIVTYNPTTRGLHLHDSTGSSFTITWWGSLLK